MLLGFFVLVFVQMISTNGFSERFDHLIAASNTMLHAINKWLHVGFVHFQLLHIMPDSKYEDYIGIRELKTLISDNKIYSIHFHSGNGACTLTVCNVWEEHIDNFYYIFTIQTPNIKRCHFVNFIMNSHGTNIIGIY